MILALLLASIPAATPPQPDTGSDLESLIAAERAFDRASAERGVREAFLEFLAEGAIVFRPGPVDGKKWFRDRPELPGTLTWSPDFAEIAAAGDLGYTSGPWTFQGNPPEAGEGKTVVPLPLAQHGHYVSIWRFEEDGVWRVVLDLGITHAKRDSEKLVRREPDPAKDDPQPTAKLRRALLDADVALANAAATKGMAEAFAAASLEDVRVYRNGAPPRVGPEAMRTAEIASPVESWQPSGGSVSRSKDLGYTYGNTYRQEENRGIPSRTYTRIWRRTPDGKWRIALDIVIPLPPPRPAELSEPDAGEDR